MYFRITRNILFSTYFDIFPKKRFGNFYYGFFKTISNKIFLGVLWPPNEVALNNNVCIG